MIILAVNVRLKSKDLYQKICVCLTIPPRSIGFFLHVVNSGLTPGPAQNSPGCWLLLLICLPIQLLLQVTYLTQKIHFFRQPRTRRTIEQQISVIVNSETNLTFNLLAPAGVLGIIPFEKIFWEKRPSTFRKGLTINEALENFLLWDNVEIFWWLFAINWLKSILIAALWRKFPLLPIKKKRRWSSSGSLHPAGGSN